MEKLINVRFTFLMLNSKWLVKACMLTLKYIRIKYIRIYGQMSSIKKEIIKKVR